MHGDDYGPYDSGAYREGQGKELERKVALLEKRIAELEQRPQLPVDPSGWREHIRNISIALRQERQ